MILAYMAEHLNATIAAYKDVSVEGTDVRTLETYAKAFMLIISKIYPSLMIIGTGFALWLNIVIAKPLFKLWHLKYPRFGPMDRWQSPEWLVWGTIISGFALFFVIREYRISGHKRPDCYFGHLSFSRAIHRAVLFE
jgi:hypothetical protein